MGAAAVIGALFAPGSETAIEQALITRGASPEQAAHWAQLGRQLAALDPLNKAFFVVEVLATRPVRFNEVATRLHVATLGSLTRGELRTEYQQLASKPGALKALADWAALRDPAQLEEFKAFLLAGLADESLTVGSIQRALQGRAERYVGEALEAVEAAMTAVATADVITEQGAVEQLLSVLKAQTAFASPQDLAILGLKRLHQKDALEVLPLAQADALLGGVAAKAWVDYEWSMAERLSSARPEPVARDFERLTSFAALPGFEAPFDAAQAQRLYPRARPSARDAQGAASD